MESKKDEKVIDVSILIETLEFYAKKETYETNVTDQWQPVTPIDEDKGEMARKALEGVRHFTTEQKDLISKLIEKIKEDEINLEWTPVLKK